MTTEAARKPKYLPVFVLMFTGLAILMILWIELFSANNQRPQLTAAQLLPEPKALTPFQLTDHAQQPLGLERLKGRWTFVFFGYTHCPDVCPKTLMVLNQFAHKLSKTPEVLDDTQFLFISVDPERDTPDHLAQFITYFNPDFIGATGSQEELQALGKQLGTMHQRAENPEAPADYHINHSLSIRLLDKQGSLTALIPKAAQNPESMVTDFQRIRDYYGE